MNEIIEEILNAYEVYDPAMCLHMDMESIMDWAEQIRDAEVDRECQSIYDFAERVRLEIFRGHRDDLAAMPLMGYSTNELFYSVEEYIEARVEEVYSAFSVDAIFEHLLDWITS